MACFHAVTLKEALREAHKVRALSFRISNTGLDQREGPRNVSMNVFHLASGDPHAPFSPANTKTSCEDRAILAVAGFVSFILLLCGGLPQG